MTLLQAHQLRGPCSACRLADAYPSTPITSPSMVCFCVTGTRPSGHEIVFMIMRRTV